MINYIDRTLQIWPPHILSSITQSAFDIILFHSIGECYINYLTPDTLNCLEETRDKNIILSHSHPISIIHHADDLAMHRWRVCCQKQVSRACIINYIPQ